MKYPKLNFLIIIRFLLICLFLLGFYYMSDKISSAYEAEVNKNLQTELLNYKLSELEKFELRNEAKEKKSDFLDNLHYFLLIILIGLIIINFLSDKIHDENKRLDELEK